MAAEAGAKTDVKIIMDVESPFYIHLSDNLGQIFITELLDGENYGVWKKDMSNALYAKNKMGFIDGTIPKPSTIATHFSHWIRCNAMVIGWLKSGLTKDIKGSIAYVETAQDIWDDLEERFRQGNVPRMYQLRRDISSIRQEKMTVIAYYTKLKSLWDKLNAIDTPPKCTCQGCTCEALKLQAARQEQERLYMFLMGLDDSYTVVRTQILSSQPMPSLGIAYRLVTQDEAQRKVTNLESATEAAAFEVQLDERNKKSNLTRLCIGRDKPRCDHCRKLGHVKEQCFELIGYPSNQKRNTRPRGAHNADSLLVLAVIESNGTEHPLSVD